jgi:hypothetical protein
MIFYEIASLSTKASRQIGRVLQEAPLIDIDFLSTQLIYTAKNTAK